MTVSRSISFGAWVGVVVVGLTAFLAGYTTASRTPAPTATETERETLELASLTSPFLECSGELNGDFSLVQARDAISAYLQEARQTDPSLEVSVYARDLDNGPWIGIDERKPFLPASLSKVPVMLYILAHAEGDPSILDRELVYPGPDAMTDQDSMEGAPEGLKMKAGERYPYRDLLYRMIVHSDNHARELLMTGITEEDVVNLMSTMHAGGGYENGEFLISPKVFSTFFRVLYNATFIGRPLSEYALSLLSQEAFPAALRRPIPTNVTVASKFGFREDMLPGGREALLHECGIVYQEDTPYVLCVMTKSAESSPDRLAEIISEVSRVVWEEKS